MEARLGLVFVTEEPHPPAPSPYDGEGEKDRGEAGIFTPEDVFHYAYAVFHWPTYRERYAEFLKIDFPRLPLTSDVGLFRALCGYGAELVDLHLMRSPALATLLTAFPVSGSNVVERGYPRFELLPTSPPGPLSTRGEGETTPVAPLHSMERGEERGRVYINKAQYFEGAPREVWAFHVGGYQVCEKWLKDRRGRALSYEDITHYQRVVVALSETIRLMAAIDAAIPAWPMV